MNFLTSLIDLFLPKICVSCKQINGQSFCKNCIEKITPKFQKITYKQYTLFSPYIYKDEIKELLHYIKFEKYHDLLPHLGALLNAGISKTELPANAVVLTVPSHESRIKERGFDIVKKILENTPILAQKKAPPLLIRSKETTALFGLTEQERQAQVKNAFSLQNAEYITGKSIILLDDIHTSGATIREISQALLKNGAKEVNAITLAYVK